MDAELAIILAVAWPITYGENSNRYTQWTKREVAISFWPDDWHKMCMLCFHCSMLLISDSFKIQWKANIPTESFTSVLEVLIWPYQVERNCGSSNRTWCLVGDADQVHICGDQNWRLPIDSNSLGTGVPQSIWCSGWSISGHVCRSDFEKEQATK